MYKKYILVFSILAYLGGFGAFADGRWKAAASSLAPLKNVAKLDREWMTNSRFTLRFGHSRPLVQNRPAFEVDQIWFNRQF